MESETIENVLIDPNLGSYEQFFDHDWCERTFEAVRTSPLKDAIDDLMIAWRSANGAHRLPWLMVETLRRFADGEMAGSLQYRADYAGRVIDGIVDKLNAKMKYSLKFDQRRALERAVVEIENEAHRDLKSARASIKFDITGYWHLLVNSTEFQFCILGTQRISYGSLFFAYEDFLASVIRTKEPGYSSKKLPIGDAFTRHFSGSLRDYCWTDAEVDLARLVRHALAHNGGRFGNDLEKYKTRFVDATGTEKALLRGDQFNLVEGKIQIAPQNTAHLFGVLKERVTKNIENVQ